MVRKTELEHLRLRRELLVLQCEANRLMLAAEWEQLQSREYWISEASKLARRHSLWAGAFAAGAGLLVTKEVRRPGGKTGWLRRLLRLASMASSIWNFFDGKDKEP